MKFQFDCLFEWKVICDIDAKSMGMIVSNNHTLENIRTGQEVPYNIGLLIIGECINSSLQMKFEEGSFLGKCD